MLSDFSISQSLREKLVKIFTISYHFDQLLEFLFGGIQGYWVGLHYVSDMEHVMDVCIYNLCGLNNCSDYFDEMD